MSAHPAVEVRVEKWLGRLPVAWRGARLCQVANVWVSNVDKLTAEGEMPVRLCNYTDVYKNDSITSNLDFMAATATLEEIERFKIRQGDTIITKDSETADDIGIAAYVRHEADDLICGYHLAIVRPDLRRINSRFLYWTMSSRPVLGQWSVLASGVTRVGLRMTDLSKATIPLPSDRDQQAIAAFLDRETSQLDALAAKQNELIGVLQERRAGVLYTLNSLEGENIRLRRLFRPSDESSRPNEEILSVYRDYGVIPKSSRSDNFNKTPENLNRYLYVRPGDLVVNRMKAWQGSLGISSNRGIVSGDYEVLRPTGEQLDPEFAHHLLRSPRMIGEYRVRSTGIRPAQWRLYWDRMADISIPVPPKSVQRDVVNRIQTQLDGIDSLISKTRNHIEFTEERRAALISAAVTGQIDVTARS